MAEVAALESIGELIRSGKLDEAESSLKSAAGNSDSEVELTFLRGYLKEMQFDHPGAISEYQQVLEKDPQHTEAAFRAAVVCDLGGDDEAAVELYERCASDPPAHVNALLNLAVHYEESGRHSEAESLVKRVLDEHPNHVRARQFLRSIEASFGMVIDDAGGRERDPGGAVLDTPISDFELSVRSRNCLRQMNVRTLGDLLRITEAELLSYKNFGETSLNEIKAMLTQRGLALGQSIHGAEAPAPTTPSVDPSSVPEESAAHLQRLVSELELSVRSRKALQRLGIITLGELAARTEAELMTIKNFGQTSLHEIRAQLAKYGLGLRKSP